MTLQEGSIELFGVDVTRLNQRQFKPFRKRLQVIFQDLDAALNPNTRVLQIMKDIFRLHYPTSDVENHIHKLLYQLKLDESVLNKYPHELSGGQKRRIAIANVLACRPQLIIADEPTTGLDRYTQSLILMLTKKLQIENNISMLLISHDLQVISENCHRVIVLYLGQIVESGPVDTLMNNPAHPYTRLLWSTFNDKLGNKTVPQKRKHDVKSGLYDFERPLHGCRFAPRCPQYIGMGKPDCCTSSTTPLKEREISSTHQVLCHFPIQHPANQTNIQLS